MMGRRIVWKMLLVGVVVAAPCWWGQAQETAPAALEVKWRHDYNAARKEAHDKGIPLLLDFGTKSCFWCKQLDMRTFRDPRVIQVMNEKFVPLKVDAEVEVSLTSTLRITSFPTIVLASPDGKILDTMVGFKEADPFHEALQRALGSVTSPDWMQRDFQLAQKWHDAGDFARAISALKTILEDGKKRPVQVSAQKLLVEIEGRASERLKKAREFSEKGQQTEAIELLTDTIRLYAGSQASKEASDLLTKVVQSPDLKNQQRTKRARELLAQAKDFYKNHEYLPCLDRCELLIANFGDLPEGVEGVALLSEIKSNPEWLQKAADTLSDRLGGVYLALADTLIKKGQPQTAEVYLQRVIQAFPGTRQAESAQIRLGQLQGTPARRVEIQAAAP